MSRRPSFTAAQRLETFKTYGAIVVCQAKGCDSAIQISEAEIDHHQALIDGGKHELSNWRPICSSCHRKKSAFEHTRNSKGKRVKAAQEIHEAVVARVMERPAGKIKSAGFSKTLRKKMSGEVVRKS